MGANAQIAVPVFTSGQVLTAAQVTQINTGVPVFATTVTRDAAFGGTGEKTLAEGQFAYIEATKATQYYNGSAWVGIGQTIAAAAVTTSQATTSTSYTDLATAGPAVTVTTGTTALVTIQTLGAGAVSNRQLMSFAVSGATTIAAGTYVQGVTTATDDSFRVSSFVVTGLTAGSNTFTTKYRSSDGNSIPFAERVITVTTL
jgi:hypothetical protein